MPPLLADFRVIAPDPTLFFFTWLLLGFALLSLLLTAFAVFEIGTRNFVHREDRTLWLLIVILLPGFGALFYLIRRKKLLA